VFDDSKLPNFWFLTFSQFFYPLISRNCSVLLTRIYKLHPRLPSPPDSYISYVIPSSRLLCHCFNQLNTWCSNIWCDMDKTLVRRTKHPFRSWLIIIALKCTETPAVRSTKFNFPVCIQLDEDCGHLFFNYKKLKGLWAGTKHHLLAGCNQEREPSNQSFGWNIAYLMIPFPVWKLGIFTVLKQYYNI
jgi:hypothetical protein